MPVTSISITLLLPSPMNMPYTWSHGAHLFGSTGAATPAPGLSRNSLHRLAWMVLSSLVNVGTPVLSTTARATSQVKALGHCTISLPSDCFRAGNRMKKVSP